MVGVPTPHTISSYAHGNAWFSVAWAPVDGAVYESQHEGESQSTKLSEPKSAIMAIARGTSRYTTIRNVIGDDTSPWVRVTLNWQGEITDIDGDDPEPSEPPKPPERLTVVGKDVEQGSADVTWHQPDRVDYWEILLENVFGNYRRASESRYTFYDLTEGSSYAYRVRAVRKDPNGKAQRSAPTRGEFVFTDEQPPPPPPPPPPVPIPAPTGLRTHCITTSSAIVEWQRAQGVDGWEVWIGDRSTAAFTESTRHTVRGLQPNTSYTVSLVARKGDGESEIVTDTFVTLADNEIEGDLPTPTGLHLEVPRPGVLQAVWDGQVPAFVPQGRTEDAFYVSCDGLETTTQTDRNGHEWTGLGSGEYVVEVYRATGGGVSGIARLAASVKGALW